MATHPVFFHRESHGHRSLVGYSPWGCEESGDAESATTEVTAHTPAINILVTLPRGASVQSVHVRMLSHLSHA